MEDFIERVGQSYLERKGFGVPQQLENLAKKQLTGGGEEEAKEKKSTGKSTSIGDEKGEGVSQASSGSSQKDKEIAKLKKELAQLKLKEPKASSGKSASGPKGSSISRASTGQKTLTSKTTKGDKKTKEPVALGAMRSLGGKHQDRKSKSGEKEAGLSKLAKEANIVEISPTKRKASLSEHAEHNGDTKSEHGGGSRSEHGSHAKSTTPHTVAPSEGKRRPSTDSQSENGGHAKSTPSHAVAPSEGKGRASNASQSEHGSTAKSIAPAPVHEHLPVHAERPQEEGAMVEWRQLRRLSEEEPDLYAVEVEEEVSRRRRKDAGGVVEVETSEGKTLYRVG